MVRVISFHRFHLKIKQTGCHFSDYDLKIDSLILFFDTAFSINHYRIK